ncbi:MAG: single-stranded DNA-binding protein [Lachnospiraceae bacterium]|nr:single-stranded DNA-binding protein [Lachnospiraceae bacterium]
MSTNISVNNQVDVTGIILENFVFSHVSFDRALCSSTIRIIRNSGIADDIPVLIPYGLFNTSCEYMGKMVTLSGQYRSCNLVNNGQKSLDLRIFIKRIIFTDGNDKCQDNNSIFLDGYICRPPIHRRTPSGLLITDLTLAVNRYSKNDYIPCICWHLNAVKAGKYKVGDRCKVKGRIQSREYFKILHDGVKSVKTAYEVSASGLSLIHENSI